MFLLPEPTSTRTIAPRGGIVTNQHYPTSFPRDLIKTYALHLAKFFRTESSLEYYNDWLNNTITSNFYYMYEPMAIDAIMIGMLDSDLDGDLNAHEPYTTTYTDPRTIDLTKTTFLNKLQTTSLGLTIAELNLVKTQLTQFSDDIVFRIDSECWHVCTAVIFKHVSPLIKLIGGYVAHAKNPKAQPVEDVWDQMVYLNSRYSDPFLQMDMDMLKKFVYSYAEPSNTITPSSCEFINLLEAVIPGIYYLIFSSLIYPDNAEATLLYKNTFFVSKDKGIRFINMLLYRFFYIDEAQQLTAEFEKNFASGANVELTNSKLLMWLAKTLRKPKSDIIKQIVEPIEIVQTYDTLVEYKVGFSPAINIAMNAMFAGKLKQDAHTKLLNLQNIDSSIDLASQEYLAWLKDNAVTTAIAEEVNEDMWQLNSAKMTKSYVTSQKYYTIVSSAIKSFNAEVKNALLYDLYIDVETSGVYFNLFSCKFKRFCDLYNSDVYYAILNAFSAESWGYESLHTELDTTSDKTEHSGLILLTPWKDIRGKPSEKNIITTSFRITSANYMLYTIIYDFGSVPVSNRTSYIIELYYEMASRSWSIAVPELIEKLTEHLYETPIDVFDKRIILDYAKDRIVTKIKEGYPVYSSRVYMPRAPYYSKTTAQYFTPKWIFYPAPSQMELNINFTPEPWDWKTSGDAKPKPKKPLIHLIVSKGKYLLKITADRVPAGVFSSVFVNSYKGDKVMKKMMVHKQHLPQKWLANN